jgi:hypothetical protein
VTIGFAGAALGLYAWYGDYRTRNDALEWEDYSNEALAQHLRKGRTVLVVLHYAPLYGSPYSEWDLAAAEDFEDANLRVLIRSKRIVLLEAAARTMREHTELFQHGPGEVCGQWF